MRKNRPETQPGEHPDFDNIGELDAYTLEGSRSLAYWHTLEIYACGPFYWWYVRDLNWSQGAYDEVPYLSYERAVDAGLAFWVRTADGQEGAGS